MKKALFFTTFLISLLSVSSLAMAATYCISYSHFVQHNPNTYKCVGPGAWDPNFPCEQVFDNNWNTYGKAWNEGDEVYVYINYTKPANATREETRWEQQSSNPEDRFNLTIPLECWERDSQTVILRGRSYYQPGGNPTQSAWQCLADSWVNIYENNWDAAAMRLFEEKMYWGICEESFDQTYIDRVDELEARMAGVEDRLTVLEVWKALVDAAIAAIQATLSEFGTRISTLELFHATTTTTSTTTSSTTTTTSSSTTTSTTTTTTSTTSTTTTTTSTTTTTIPAVCQESPSSCEAFDGTMLCNQTITGCLYKTDWKYFRVNESAGKQTTVTLTHSGADCNMNDLFIYDSACDNEYKSYKNQITESWTGMLGSDVIVGIDGDTTNERCLWTLSVGC